MNKIEIEIPEGKKAEWVNGVLTLVDDVKVRIKTFEDACNELGKNHQYVRAYREWMRISYAECKDIAAYLKLRIICEALNEGWRPTFNKDKFYSPWFYVHLENKPKNNKYLYYGVNTHGGYVCAHTNYAGTHAVTYYGMQLVLRTKELAEYCGKQFIDIWCDYLFG